jgi:hypothetical protein
MSVALVSVVCIALVSCVALWLRNQERRHRHEQSIAQAVGGLEVLLLDADVSESLLLWGSLKERYESLNRDWHQQIGALTLLGYTHPSAEVRANAFLVRTSFYKLMSALALFVHEQSEPSRDVLLFTHSSASDALELLGGTIRYYRDS